MEYKGQLKGFPKEVVDLMLKRQVEQGNKEDISVFERELFSDINEGGITWSETHEGDEFWEYVMNGNFDVFFELYPKQTEPKQSEPKYGDIVYCHLGSGNWVPRVLIKTLGGGACLTWQGAVNVDESKNIESSDKWRPGERRTSPPITKYTKQQIADKIGEDVDSCEITTE